VLGSIVTTALLVIVALLVAMDDDGGGGGGDRPPITEGAHGGVQPAGFSAFDPPPGDNSEGDDRVAAAFDGDGATAWRSECYSSPDFGNLKDGVGLVVELPAARAVEQLLVDSPTEGWQAEVYATAEGPPVELSGWGDPVTSGEGETSSTFDLGGVDARYVLLWFTDLGPTASPDCNSRPFGVSVSELQVV
jgi:hypothetical protein